MWTIQEDVVTSWTTEADVVTTFSQKTYKLVALEFGQASIPSINLTVSA